MNDSILDEVVSYFVIENGTKTRDGYVLPLDNYFSPKLKKLKSMYFNSLPVTFSLIMGCDGCVLYEHKTSLVIPVNEDGAMKDVLDLVKKNMLENLSINENDIDEEEEPVLTEINIGEIIAEARLSMHNTFKSKIKNIAYVRAINADIPDELEENFYLNIRAAYEEDFNSLVQYYKKVCWVGFDGAYFDDVEQRMIFNVWKKEYAKELQKRFNKQGNGIRVFIEMGEGERLYFFNIPTNCYTYVYCPE